MSEMSEADRQLAEAIYIASGGGYPTKEAVDSGRRLVTAELAAKALPDEDGLIDQIAKKIACGACSVRDDSDVDWRAYREEAENALDAMRPHIAALQARAETAEAKYDEALYIDHESVLASVGVGRWLSAALDDPNVCDEMKADIRRWFASGHPSFKWGEQAERDQAVARAEAAEAENARLREALANPPRHVFWGAGERGCPREIKDGNGELHTLRCKVCGLDNPRDDICRAALGDKS